MLARLSTLVTRPLRAPQISGRASARASRPLRTPWADTLVAGGRTSQDLQNLLQQDTLVAGVGFEPTTFRL